MSARTKLERQIHDAVVDQDTEEVIRLQGQYRDLIAVTMKIAPAEAHAMWNWLNAEMGLATEIGLELDL